MRVIDYWRLGIAGVKAHKKRALTVVMIVGLLFSVITAGAFILQGLENVALETMLAPTGGRVLVMSSVDTKICGEGCDIAAEVAEIGKNVEKYGGEIVPTEVIQTAEGTFYKLKDDVFDGARSGGDNEVTEVAVPLKVAAKLADIEIPERDVDVAEKLEAVQEVREKTLYQTVESKTGEKYYIAEILPGGVYVNDLAFAGVEQDGNPLDLILGQINTGTSQNFIIEPGGVSLEVGDSGVEGVMDFIDAGEMGVVFAKFDGLEMAYNYYRDGANYCSGTDRIFGNCGKAYKYQVVAAVSNPLMAYENLQSIWSVFKIIAVVLVVTAVVIALSTYARLIGKDMKIISLYHVIGATGWQIRMVYVMYLVILSVMAVGFAVIVGLILAAIVSLVNMEALGQVFMLGFGVAEKEIWLVGWNNLVWWLVGVMLLAAIIVVVLGNGNFTSKELAKKMK